MGSTQSFEEDNIFKHTPNLVKLLIGIGKELICAKDYLYKSISRDVYQSTIELFGQYTLEAIIIYVLGILYTTIQESSVVRVSTLVDKLDNMVRAQASRIRSQNLAKNINPTDSTDSTKDTDCTKEGRKRVITPKYEIGIQLLEFMLERKFISIESFPKDTKMAVVKEKGKGYLETNLFAVCNFELNHLPLKLNLPMVCKPVNWRCKSVGAGEDYLMLSDMRGGYLSEPTVDIYIIVLALYHPIT